MRPPADSTPVSPDEAAELLAPLLDARGVLAAVSGGPDSMALMLLLARWREDVAAAPPVHVATVDHGLRQAAALEAAAVGEAAARLGLPHWILHWSGPKPARGIQAAAREARYRLLAEEAGRLGASHVVTAHHAGDQAETVLMRLLRGSGIAGLAGMRALRPLGDVVLARPLLPVPKARLVATARAGGLPVFADPTNEDTAHERTRVRRALEALAEEGLDTSRLATFAARAARAEEALAEMASEYYAKFSRADDRCVLLAPEALDQTPEMILRLLLTAVARCAPGFGGLLRLERAEHLAEALREARRARRPLRRTLGGCLVALDRHGQVTIGREKGRRRGSPRVHDPQTPAD